MKITGHPLIKLSPFVHYVDSLILAVVGIGPFEGGEPVLPVDKGGFAVYAAGAGQRRTQLRPDHAIAKTDYRAQNPAEHRLRTSHSGQRERNSEKGADAHHVEDVHRQRTCLGVARLECPVARAVMLEQDRRDVERHRRIGVGSRRRAGDCGPDGRQHMARAHCFDDG